MEQWREDVIAHYNHRHDKLGRFDFNPLSKRQQRSNYKKIRDAFVNDVKNRTYNNAPENLNIPYPKGSKSIHERFEKAYEDFIRRVETDKKFHITSNDPIAVEYRQARDQLLALELDIVDNMLGKYGKKKIYAYDADPYIEGSTIASATASQIGYDYVAYLIRTHKLNFSL